MVITLVLLLLSPGVSAHQRKSNEDGQTSQQTTNYKNAYPEPHRVNVQYPSDAGINTKSSKYEKKYRTDPVQSGLVGEIAAFATVAVAVFALVTAVLVGIQIKTARDIERSWLLVHLTGNPDPEWPYMTRGGYVPRILIRFKVFGKTPIHITDVRLIAKFIPRIRNVYPPQPNLPLTPNYAGISIDHTCVNQNGTMPPDAILEIHRSVSSDDCDRETVKKVVKGDLLLCAYGRLMYKDNFGRPKETRVCYVYDFKSEVPDIIDGEEVFAPAGFRKAGTEAYNKAT